MVDRERLKAAADRLRREIASEVSRMPGHREYLERETSRLAEAS